MVYGPFWKSNSPARKHKVSQVRAYCPDIYTVFSGLVNGLCFPNNQCFGTPTACRKCTEICTFAEGEKKNLPKNKDFLGSDDVNGKCNYDCDPEGSDPRFQQIPTCRVEFKPSGIYSGPTSGLCFPDDSCHGTPNACQDCKNHCKSVEK